MALDDEPDDVYLARHRLQGRAVDARLLASALAFKEGRPVARVLVLTADTGLSIKFMPQADRCLPTWRARIRSLRAHSAEALLMFKDGNTTSVPQVFSVGHEPYAGVPARHVSFAGASVRFGF